MSLAAVISAASVSISAAAEENYADYDYPQATVVTAKEPTITT